MPELKKELISHVINGDLASVIECVKQGSGISNMALIEAASQGYIDIVEYFINIGIPIYSIAVKAAIDNKHYDIMDKFISHGYELSVNILTTHLMSNCTKLESVSYLVSKGIIIDNSHLRIAIDYCDLSTLSFLLKNSDFNDDAYIDLLNTMNDTTYERIDLIIDKIKDLSKLDSLLIYLIIHNYDKYIISYLTNKSNHKDETDKYIVFRNILSHFSDDDYRKLFSKNSNIDQFIKYILKNELTDFKRAINILREKGIDVYDMVENEK